MIIDGCNPSNWDDVNVYPTLLKGGVTAVNATIAFWEGYSATADRCAAWIERARHMHDQVLLVENVSDIEVARRTGRVGIILGWQNLSPIENDVRRLDLFHALGVRIMQLTYNIRNLVGNGCFERSDDGLSLFGVEVVRRMNELGVLIDLSHVGDRSSREAIDLSEKPVAFTHVNIREDVDSPRNKPADLLRAAAERGGVIGVNAFPQFLSRGYESDLDDYLDAIERVVELVGVDSTALASDFCQGWTMDDWRYLRALHGTFDRGVPSVPRPDPAIKGMSTAADFPVVSVGLRNRGFSEDEALNICGRNWLRLYGEVW